MLTVRTKIARTCCLLFLLFLSVACNTQSNTEPEKDNSTIIESPSLLSLGEGFTNPLGYYESTPRFSWKMSTRVSTD